MIRDPEHSVGFSNNFNMQKKYIAEGLIYLKFVLGSYF